VYEGSNLETITGLAVNPSGTQLGVHAIEYDDGAYDYKSYVMVLSANDGSYLTKMARIQHGRRNYGEFIASSSGMILDNYGRLYMAFSMVARYTRDSDNG
jgi:hypothetical protein